MEQVSGTKPSVFCSLLKGEDIKDKQLDNVSSIFEKHLMARQNEITEEFRLIRRSSIWSRHQDADLMIDGIDYEIEGLLSVLSQDLPKPSEKPDTFTNPFQIIQMISEKLGIEIKKEIQHNHVDIYPLGVRIRFYTIKSGNAGYLLFGRSFLLIPYAHVPADNIASFIAYILSQREKAEGYAQRIVTFAQGQLSELRKAVMVAQIKRSSYLESVKEAIESISGFTFISLEIMDGRVSVRAERGKAPNSQTMHALFREVQMEEFLKDPLPMMSVGVAGLYLFR